VSATPEPKTAARAAAEWWAKQVGAPVHRIVRDEERDLRTDFFEVGMLVAASKHPVSDDTATAFADALEKLYDDLLVRCRGRVSLGVDYGPDQELAEVAKAHGIHAARFPMKTNMWAYPDHVTASLGYHGPTRLVWAHPDWERGPCRSVEYDERSEKFGDAWCTLPIYHEGGHGDWAPDPRRCAGCGLSEGGHYNRRVPGDWHSFETQPDPEGGESR
jgi:hypothetical protein